MGDHAILAPSAAPQWGNCSGSVRAQAARPNLDSEATREGTAAHWVMAEALLTLRRLGGVANGFSCVVYLGQTAPNGVRIDSKIVEGAQLMVDDVTAVCDRFNAWPQLLVEHRVHMPRVHPENWGTLDTALYLPERELLFLWDYKHGHRQCVSAWNLQLIDYLEGLVEQYGIDGGREQRVKTVVRVVQPFFYGGANGPIDEWLLTLSDIRGPINQLIAKAHEVYNAPTLTTGPWCRDCGAVGACSAVRLSRYNFIDYVDQPYAMDVMTGADLAIERGILVDGLAVAKARLEAIEDELAHRVRSGDVSSGLMLETGRGRLEWTVPPQIAAALALQLGVDIAVPEVLTPTQAKAAAPKAIRPLLEKVMEGVTQRPAGSLKLVQAANSLGARAFRRNT